MGIRTYKDFEFDADLTHTHFWKKCRKTYTFKRSNSVAKPFNTHFLSEAILY